MIDTLLVTIATISAALIVYHHAGYPVLLKLLARRAGEPVRPPAVTAADDLPSVRIIVPAHNETKVIAQKIANLAALDYPQGKISVLIALDGCTDDTATVVAAALGRLPRNDRFTVVTYAQNRGKIAVLNEQIEQASEDIVVLSDASATVNADSLKLAARWFSDDQVGVVCGTYRVKVAGSEGERAYWDYQVAVKAAEAAVAAPMGAHGAFYMFRRRLWTPLPSDTINDDFILPMRIVAQGYRAVYDRDIVALELERTEAEQEFRRRIRIGAGNMQQLVRMPRLLNPRLGAAAFVFASGKALRPLIPFLAIAGFVASAILAAGGSVPFMVLVALAIATGGVAWYAVRRRGSSLPQVVQWLGYLAEGHTASFIGAVQFLAGARIGSWQPDGPDAGGADAGWRYVSPAVAVSKRAFDIVLASLGLLLLAILFPFVAFMIRRDSPGPLFYRQLRVGRATPNSTEIFQLIKFRTMYIDAEKRGAQWATRDDPRITPFGRFMRKTRIDELPQFINVLKGEMSIIGPRPERPGYFTQLEQAIPFYIERTYGVRPGITGLAQVHLPYDETIEDVRMKCVYDHAYATRISSWRNWLMTDLEIVGKTVAVMAGRKGQ